MNLEQYTAKYGEEDGLRRWKRNEYSKQWRQSHREEILEYQKQYHQTHREEQLEYQKQYHKAHQEERLEYNKRWYQAHRKEKAKYNKQRYQTPYGRAQYLISGYRQSDRRYNRGDCALTVKWVVDNIFTRSCIYCGERDWQLLGCDRKNNSKPHTIENVVCSCDKCNNKRGKKDILDFAYSIGAKESDGIVVWNGDTQ